jgi:curved DNA-binding protein
MKYKDYYAILGVDRKTDLDAIKKAYRKLAHKYHPDVSKHSKAEEHFKEIAEAYATLKDAEKRAAYDALGSYQPGDEIRPPPDWGPQDGGGAQFSFDDVDLSELFAHLGRGGAHRAHAGRGAMQFPGEDFEVSAPVSLEDAFHGTILEFELGVPEVDARGVMRRAPRKLKARIPKGATDGQRLRLRGQGGKGINGGPDGDLYLNIALRPHRLFRADGHDLYLDLPLAPWEAVLGASVEIPTLAGTVQLKVPAGTQAGQKLRLAKRGLPRPHEGEGDLFAIVQIAVPAKAGEKEQALYRQLAEGSEFNPRRHFTGGA